MLPIILATLHLLALGIRAAAQQSLGPVETLAPTGRRLARISDVQTLLVVAIVVAAVLMARGFGARS